MEEMSNINNDTEKSESSNYLTPKQVPKKHHAFSESSVRYLIFHEHTNGFSKCIRRIGKKILISERDFIEWIEAQNNGGSNA